MSKKYKKVIDHFSGTEVGVLVEEFTSQVKFVGENVMELGKRMDKMDSKMDKMDSRMDRMENNIEIIKMDMEIIKHELKNKIGRDEFAILEHRVALLESRAR